ncbi:MULTISPECIES: MDR family MFS transporter [Microbacterium]|jgi:EmrB/QacA subfamily drug resistance transporter|uniref:MDR family MFS transporter n=1 Tax=Microbacterium TaxID=33882 RepID=UPI00076774B2|nr:MULTISPECIES: MDR family MFS transporter [Microbacterium]AVL98137.1 MFS transporter [Microbacterium sp. str. 'China']MCK2032747.1 MFS transporter [Microbacterium sp. KSW4-4]MCT2223231.1 MFS transporter [Microbacterium paraoxydans]MPT15868.1 DHA2 family efflux MFS transporter permease subunit [Microbacterium sp.]OSP07511.1 MFS transporter [Microbacterium sp. LEMMJ01]
MQEHSPVTHTSSSSETARSAREVFTAISGLIVGMFVAVLSGTVVSTSMPVIIADLGGTQSQYTWVITASLLATAVSTPIWGKLADLVDRKVLIQISLILFTVGTVIAGFSTDTNMLIAVRVVQGIGVGGLMSLVMIAVALIISPRERGKYMGVVGGIMALGTIGGPLLGGVITDAWGWRANFFVGVPFAIVALVLLQFTLHLPKPQRGTKVSIDYFGIVLLAVGVSTLLIWVSMGGNQFDWDSGTSIALAVTAGVAIAAFVAVEFFVKEPIVPMSLFRNRTFTLSVIASIAIGVSMFATSVFLAQYFQLARGATPTESGLMTIPMIIGQMGASIIIGQLVSRFGKWKGWMVTGSILATIGVSLMATLRYDTPFTLVAVYMFVLGAGLGMVMQNLTLIVQNDTAPQQLGAASSNVNFFRTIAGTIGVTVMGSLLSTSVADFMKDGLKGFVPTTPDEISALERLGSGDVPKVGELPDTIRTIVESAYGHGIADAFILAIPLAVIAIIAIAFIKNKPLSTKNAAEQLREQAEESVIEVSEAEVGANLSTGTIRTGQAGPATTTGSVSVLERDDRKQER